MEYDGGGAGAAAFAGIMLIVNLFALVIGILMIVSWWKIFDKAGQPGWASIVPIYNAWVMVEMAGYEALYFFLMLIPGVNIVIGIMVLNRLMERFGKGVGYTVGMLVVPYVLAPMLAFGDAEYR